jgi:hypothetical protein
MAIHLSALPSRGSHNIFERDWLCKGLNRCVSELMGHNASERAWMTSSRAISHFTGDPDFNFLKHPSAAPAGGPGSRTCHLGASFPLLTDDACLACVTCR